MNINDILNKYDELAMQFRQEAQVCEFNIKNVEANPLIVERWKNRAEFWVEASDYLRAFTKDIRKEVNN